MVEVLFVTRNFPPLIGGMERLLLEATKASANRWTTAVLGPRGCENALRDIECKGIGYKNPLVFVYQSRRVARRIAKNARPKLLVAGSALAAPAVVHGAVVGGAKSAAFVHGLDLVHPNPIYRALCLPPLKALNLVIANSANTAALVQAAGVPRSRLAVLHPGVDLPPGLPRQATSARDGKTLLFVGRRVRRKGLAAFVRHALPRVVEQVPDVRLLIVGSDAGNALSKSSRGELDLQAAIVETNNAGRVEFMGVVDDRELSKAYAMADLFVFPVVDLPGDVEGFGMVALEAAAHGLPTLAFRAGGVPDAVAHGLSGTLVEAGDYRRFADCAASYLLGDDLGVTPASCYQHASQYTWSGFGRQLRDLLGQLTAG